MNGEMLMLDCAEWRDVAGISPAEMEVVVEMMIEAGEKLCSIKSTLMEHKAA